MTASVSHAHTSTYPSRHTGTRIAVGLLGAATFVLGVVLLANPVHAAHTLAVLMGLALVVGGLLEVAVGWDSRSRWGAVVLGGILVVGGILAMVWPGITLWAVAVVTGLTLLAHGAGRLALAVAARHEIQGWSWLAAAGAFGILCGILALAWPEATVLVLCIVLGAQVVALGLLLTIAAFLPYGTTPRAPAGA